MESPPTPSGAPLPDVTMHDQCLYAEIQPSFHPDPDIEPEPDYENPDEALYMDPDDSTGSPVYIELQQKPQRKDSGAHAMAPSGDIYARVKRH